MRKFLILGRICAIGGRRLYAQEAHTPEAVRTAMENVLRVAAQGHDTLRFAPDSAAVWRDFVRCHDVDGRAICALTENKPVAVVNVHMMTPDSAEVDIQHYRMVDRVCPMGPAIVPPRIVGDHLGGSWWTMRYVDGKWIAKDHGVVMTC